MRFPCVTVKQSDFLVVHDFDDVFGVFQGWVWLTKVVPSIFRVQWVHTGAIIVNSDASGSLWGSLKGLEFPM